MIGNAWELTTDTWRPNHSQPAMAEPDQMPSGMAAMGGAQRVIKGGSFLCAPNFCARYRSGSRQPQDEDLGASHLGFRTILIAAGP
jgi:formylglycine-generating enzyme